MPHHCWSSRRFRCALGLCAAAALLVAAACSGKKGPAPRTRSVTPIVRDTPAPLRSTVGAVARLNGVLPARVSGIGFVVGLDGTGGLPLQDQIAAHVEREMSLQGVGRPGTFAGTPLEGVTPREMLADRNTAVVIVEAAVPPGARSGQRFDVYVRALNATSLEGGQLWTTQLRVGPPSAFGDVQARVIGQAGGPVFINPFAEPNATGDAVQRTIGRVLDGGSMTDELEVQILLDNPSHARARLITSIINSTFPARSGDRGPTARGRDESLISVTVPYRYRDRRSEFARLIQYLTIDPSYPEVYARRYAQVMRDQPELAVEMSWCLEALGEKALPFIRPLYFETEVIPRLAALRAGASLGDPQSAQPLIELALAGNDADRAEAIRLLSRVDGGPRVEQALRTLLREDALIIRVAAYEALADRAEAAHRRRLLATGGADATITRVDMLARASLPAGTPFGVQRSTIDHEFLLDRVPFGDPLIYVSQQGQPRIVIFGETPEVNRPTFVSAWSNRLMLISDTASDPLRLSYQDPARGRRVMTPVEEDLPSLIAFLAHTPTPDDPRPGLGLSYSEVVGLLYELSRQRAIDAAFSTEQDHLLALLLEAGETREITVRPEAPGEAAQVLVLTGSDDPRRPLTPPRRPTRDGKPTLVPLKPEPGSEGEPGAAPDGGEAAPSAVPSRPE